MILPSVNSKLGVSSLEKITKIYLDINVQGKTVLLVHRSAKHHYHPNFFYNDHNYK